MAKLAVSISLFLQINLFKLSGRPFSWAHALGKWAAFFFNWLIYFNCVMDLFRRIIYAIFISHFVEIAFMIKEEWDYDDWVDEMSKTTLKSEQGGEEHDQNND